MLDFIFGLHSGVRYLVLLAALLAAIGAILVLVRGHTKSALAARLNTIFVGLVDLQILIGLVLLVLRGFYPQLLGHVMMMLVAAAVAHGFAMAARRREAERPAGGLRLLGVMLTLVLVVGGIMAIGRPVL